jgi:hypothetical protein
MTAINLDLTQTKAQEGFDPLPPGEYQVQVTDTQVTQSKSGNPMLKIVLTVLGPTHQGRRLFDMFVLNNDIAMSRLKGMATAGGHQNPDYIRDTEELHGLRMQVKVKIEEQPGYNAQNRISSYKRIGNGGAAHPAAPAVPQIAPPPPAAPWAPQQQSLQMQPAQTQPAPVAQPPAGPRMPWS